ncbi:MAG TPA: hypothetical protein VKQ52_11715 [Puia sp.]|nr:hypothetical protein [Puia sp.]
MSNAIIRLAYRQIIDMHSITPFEQKIFSVTFAEFGIQQQSFSKGMELYTWESIRNHFPKSQQALPFKVSFSIAGLISSLQNKIPGLEDALGNENIPFTQHRFSLIASDVRDPSVHAVSLTWITDDLILHGIIGDQLLLSQQPPQTFQVKMQPGLSVISYTPCEERSTRQPFATMASL